MIHTSEIERRLRRATRALGMPSIGGGAGGVPPAGGDAAADAEDAADGGDDDIAVDAGVAGVDVADDGAGR